MRGRMKKNFPMIVVETGRYRFRTKMKKHGNDKGGRGGGGGMGEDKGGWCSE
jgi:hypothetical protein